VIWNSCSIADIHGSKLKLEQIGAINSCRKNMTGTAEVAEKMIYLMEN